MPSQRRRWRGRTDTPSKERYTFEYPGSTQGFLKCEYPTGAADVRILNENEVSGKNGLLVGCMHVAKGVTANVATQTFIDFSKLAQNFSTVASPTFYSSQVVSTVSLDEKSGEVVFAPTFCTTISTMRCR